MEMNKIFSLLLIIGATIWLSACMSPRAAPTLEGEDKTAESQSPVQTHTADNLTSAPTLPPEGTEAPTGSPEAEIPTTPVSDLKPADADSPAAGICADPPRGEFVVMTIRPDVPDPRCAKARPDQQLVLVNGTESPVQALLGKFDVTIQPGEEGRVDIALGEYLAPGVHFIQVSAPGLGGELWLVEK